MASAVLAKPPGVAVDDEEWLYGGEGANEGNEPAAPGTGPTKALPAPKEREEGEMSTSEPASQSQEKDDDDDEEDSDDDDVQVTIGDIKAFPVTSGSGLFKPGTTYQKQPVIASASQKSAGGGGVPVKGVDVDGEGQVNGISLYEFSLDTLRDEDKPWRKPGADITDYFNYGFNEETWRKYCQKQTRQRTENGVAIPKAFNYSTPSSGHGTTAVKVEQEQARTTRPPAPSQPFTGAIAVLGSTAASRRPAEEQMDAIQTIGTLGANVNKPPPGMPPMGMPAPDFSVPPPGMPPMPPGFSPAVPPPGMNVPPPNMFSHPPPPFFPPGTHMPPPVVSERPAFSSYETTPTQSTYTDAGNKSWDSRDDRDSYRDRDRDYYGKRDRSPGGSGYSSGGSDEYSSSRYSRSNRDYGSSRDYESREYYRGRDSDRSRSDRDRDRSRSRSRDRDRRPRDRDRDKSKRKIKDEPDDSDYYKSSSSKHKKSKRSKRDKDDEKSSDT